MRRPITVTLIAAGCAVLAAHEQGDGTDKAYVRAGDATVNCETVVTTTTTQVNEA